MLFLNVDVQWPSLHPSDFALVFVLHFSPRKSVPDPGNQTLWNFNGFCILGFICFTFLIPTNNCQSSWFGEMNLQRHRYRTYRKNALTECRSLFSVLSLIKLKTKFHSQLLERRFWRQFQNLSTSKSEKKKKNHFWFVSTFCKKVIAYTVILYKTCNAL